MRFSAADALRHWITSRLVSLRILPINRLSIITAITVAMMALAVAASAQPVTLVVDGQAVTIRTFDRTVGEVLADRNIRPSPQDRVIPAEDSPVYRGETIRIVLAVPVRIKLDGKEVLNRMTASETVAGVLKENGIVVGPGDQVTPGLDTPVAAGLQIAVNRLTTKTKVENVPLPFSTTRESSPDLFRGLFRVVRLGRPGLAKQVWQVSFRNGVPYAKKLVSSKIVRQPRDQVVQVGALDEVSRGGRVLRFSRVIVARATAYDGGGLTATGTVPRIGTIAVDPRVIPLGSRLYVEGYGYGTALDTGGLIKGDRVDLYFNTNRTVVDWGVRYVKVFVLK